MLTTEICSYPKSGNTWLTNLVDQFLIDCNAQNHQKVADIHKDPELVAERIENRLGSKIAAHPETLYFYKSHPFKNPLINPKKVLYIYRHPLDVFLSTLNWFYIHYNHTPKSYTAQRKKQLFYRSEPKSCEDIIKDREIDFYLDRFIENLGTNFHPGMLGENGNYFKHVSNAINDADTTCLKYEDLILDTNGEFLSAIQRLLDIKLEHITIDTKKVDNATKGSGHPFYWKAKSGTRFDMLSSEQIERFEKAHSDSLSKIGF
jgi:hypothetical protein